MNTEQYNAQEISRLETSNYQPEIFVLPPNVLQKLGINLGNIETSQECPTNNKILPDESNCLVNEDISIAEPHINLNTVNDISDSMIETANLMKNSVFLSPTFSTNACMLSGELEISTVCKQAVSTDTRINSEQDISNINCVGMRDVSSHFENKPESPSNIKKQLKDNISHFTSTQSPEVLKSDILLSNDLNNLQNNINSNTCISNKLENDESIISFDDHLDEAYSSDCSNSHLGSMSTDISILEIIENEKLEPKNDPNKKINIISEEIIDSSRIKQSNTLYFPNKAALIPVTINTVVSKHISDKNNTHTNAFVEEKTNHEINNQSYLDSIVIYDSEGNIIQNSDEVNSVSLLTADAPLHILPCNVDFLEINDMDKGWSSIDIVEYMNEPKSQDSLGKPNSIEKRETDLQNKAIVNQELEPMCHKEPLETDYPSNVSCHVNDTQKNNIFSDKEESLKENENNSALLIDNSKSIEIITYTNEDGANKNFTQSISDNNVHIYSNIILKHKGTKNCISETLINSDKESDKIIQAEIQTNNLKITNNSFEKNKNVIKCSIETNKTESFFKKSVNDSDISAMNLEKAKEIAEYFKIISHDYLKKRISKTDNNTIELKSQVDHNNRKLKMCVDGVEKPGGVKLKTYKSKNPKIHASGSNYKDHSIVKETQKREDSNIDIKDKEVHNLYNLRTKTEFCLCSDYGRLSHNDNDNLYQHVHFWNQTNIKCNSDIIFGIYSDEIIYYSERDDSRIDESIKEECIGSINQSICWNNIENIKSINADITQHESEVFNILSTSSPIIVDANQCSLDISDINQGKIVGTLENKDNDLIELKKKVNSYSDSGNVIDEVENNSDLNIYSEKLSRSKGTDDRVKETTDVIERGKKKSVPRKNNSTINNKNETPVQQVKTYAKKSRKKHEKSHITSNNDEPHSKKRVKCGVCNTILADDEWADHSQGHCFIAWKFGENFNLEDPDLLRNIQRKLKNMHSLSCPFCSSENKQATKFISHVKECIKEKGLFHISVKNNKGINKINEIASTSFEGKIVKCAVCNQKIKNKDWNEHICREHNYLAWKEGESALDIDNEEVIRRHLSDIVKQVGTLTCAECGLNIKFVKIYLQHIKGCNSNSESSSANVTVNNSIMSDGNSSISSSMPECIKQELNASVRCGVCQTEMDAANWISHIEKAHDYLAWTDEQTPLDVKNPDEVEKHLTVLLKKLVSFSCSKCCVRRNNVKAYLQHMKTCKVISSNSIIASKVNRKDIVQCAMCSMYLEAKSWQSHAMENHYNVAWKVNETPINIRSQYVVGKYLMEYKQIYKNFICKVCGIYRASAAGFFAHIVTCGKSEEETAMFKDTCDICNNKYLFIYKNQHFAIHREQDYAKERKLKAAARRMEAGNNEMDTTNRRQAAQKAKSMIESYTKDISSCTHKCSTCEFGTNDESEMVAHKCKDVKNETVSDSDESVKLEPHSENESADTDIESEASFDEEEEIVINKKKKKKKDSLASKTPRMPFAVKNVNDYLQQSAKDFLTLHFTSECLYPYWNNCEYEEVTESEISKYLPPLEESCQVKISNDDWRTYKRFEVNQAEVCTIFVGASIQCISWAPSHIQDAADRCGAYLAVACHRGADCPRYLADDIVRYCGFLQLWDFGKFDSKPKLALGISHEYGNVWDMAWCPSGARDLLPEQLQPNKTLRLGLLAIACSNGSAYIFSVPYPSTLPIRHKIYYNLKPVAELRISASSLRKIYQATAISWSMQKGHAVIIVGYGDGTTAFYNLNYDSSPLLNFVENRVTIINPYYDERPHNSCITGVDLLASADESVAVGASCSSSATGASGTARVGGAAAARVLSHIASERAAFAPHWPSILLTGDDGLMNYNVNELEWWGVGRRLGCVRSSGACVRCGRRATHAPPLLHLTRPHPADPHTKKQVIAILEMSSLAQKRRKHVNDELSMKLEPISYEDAIKKYGLKFKLVDKRDKVVQQQALSNQSETCPERFPLADVPSMEFVPSTQNHNKLAVATHAGFIFLIHV